MMPAKRGMQHMRFRSAIFRSMADSWAPNEEPARLARESIDSLRGFAFVRLASDEATMKRKRKNRAPRHATPRRAEPLRLSQRRKITPPSDHCPSAIDYLTVLWQAVNVRW